MHDEAGIVSTRMIHAGRIIDITEDEVRFPNGSVGNVTVVRHPGASAVVPFLGDPCAKDPALLLIRQYRYAANGFLLEVPAGRLDTDETPESCARRELAEETGCTAGTITPMTTIFTTPGFCDERIHLFMAADLHQGEPHRETDEFIEPVTLLMSDTLARIERGEICDGKTIAALLFAARFRTLPRR